MSNIFKRESLQSKGRKLRVDNNRKKYYGESQNVSGRKIALFGLNKQDYMI